MTGELNYTAFGFSVVNYCLNYSYVLNIYVPPSIGNLQTLPTLNSSFCLRFFYRKQPIIINLKNEQAINFDKFRFMINQMSIFSGGKLQINVWFWNNVKQLSYLDISYKRNHISRCSYWNTTTHPHCDEHKFQLCYPVRSSCSALKNSTCFHPPRMARSCQYHFVIQYVNMRRLVCLWTLLQESHTLLGFQC